MRPKHIWFLAFVLALFLVTSAKASSFEQKLDRRVRFDTAGRTLVTSIVELAFTYQLPTGIEYADREATTRPLSLHFQNESVRRILEALTEQVPGYGVSFSGGIVDIFAAKGREDPSNLLNKVIKSFEVSELDTDRADIELFCALSHEVTPSGWCGGSHAAGPLGPLKITLHLRNAKVYEVPISLFSCMPSLSSSGLVDPVGSDLLLPNPS